MHRKQRRQTTGTRFGLKAIFVIVAALSVSLALIVSGNFFLAFVGCTSLTPIVGACAGYLVRQDVGVEIGVSLGVFLGVPFWLVMMLFV